ncbi:MAG TPA: insulinase family protein, partial [Steroidobacteraceae bacterium]
IRLREVLREDMGGTYGVSIGSSASREPEPLYSVRIGFGADPQRLDDLTREVFAQIESLKRDGPSPDELAKVKEAQRREWETNMRRNSWWIAQIVAREMLGEPIADVETFPQRLEAVTAEQITSAARNYLRTDRYVRVSLVPER